ncbi:MAG: hypothetical protein QXM55_03325 [Ignisphaera sp.]
MYVSVSYGINFTKLSAPYFVVMDYTEPDIGRVRIRYWVEKDEFDENRLNNVLFTVGPSSFGFLDPNKPGGYMPMIIHQSFYMELNTGDNVTIAFQVSLGY